MDSEKLKKDFSEVYSRISKSDRGFRCHEYAFLIHKGMKERGYNAKLKHGFYYDLWNHLFHSWVEVDEKILDQHNWLVYYFGRSDLSGVQIVEESIKEIRIPLGICKPKLIDVRLVKRPSDTHRKAVYINIPFYKPKIRESAKELALELFDS